MELLTAEEVASILKVQKRYIYQLKAEHKIPFVIIGKGALRFRKVDIEKWIEDLATQQ